MKKVLLLVSLLWTVTAAAGDLPSYQDLCRDLKDLPGWKAPECTGMNMDSPRGKMTMAMRTYSLGDRQLQVSVVAGAQAAANWTPFERGMQVETPEQLFKTTEVDGFPVGITYDKKARSGAIIVGLKEKGGKAYEVLTVSFNGLGWKEALEWARKFDWERMAERVK